MQVCKSLLSSIEKQKKTKAFNTLHNYLTSCITLIDYLAF